MDLKKLVRATTSLGAVLSVLALGACDDDPTEAGRGDPSLLIVNRAALFQPVGSSFTLIARVEDEQRNRLAGPTDDITVTSTNTAVVQVDSASFVPELVEKRFFLKFASFDTASIIVTSGGLSDTIAVTNFPASLQIEATVPDTMRSGTTAQLIVEGLDVTGQSLGSVPFEVDEISDTDIITVDETGLITAHEAGQATITVLGPGGVITTTARIQVIPGTIVSAEPANDTALVSTVAGFETTTVEIIASDAEGNENRLPSDLTSLTATSLDGGVASVVASIDTVASDTVEANVTITAEGGGATQVVTTLTTVDGVFVDTIDVHVVVPTITSVTPATGPFGTEVTVRGSDLAFEGQETTLEYAGEDVTQFITETTDSLVSFLAPAAGAGTHDIIIFLAGIATDTAQFTQVGGNTDSTEPLNDDPSTAPAVTLPYDAAHTVDATDVDDFFTIVLPADATVSVDLDWNTDADLDILFWDPAADDLIACFAGATGAQPEAASCDLTAGTYQVWINNYSASPLTTYRVTIVEE